MSIETTADRYPTRTSTALVVFVSALTAGALARAADVFWPAVVGSVGAVTLAVVLWASGWERHRAVGNVVASVLVLPVGLGIVATTAGTVLVLAEGLFPVPTAAAIPETVIRMSARAMVVTGAAAAVFGAVAATRGILDRDAVERAGTTAFRTALVPFLAAVVLGASAGLGHLAANAAGPGPGSAVSDLLGSLDRVFFQPDPFGPHLPTFVLMAGVALFAAQRGVRALPLPELLADGDRRSVERAQRTLFWAAVAVLATLPVAAVVHIAAPPRQLRLVVGPAVYDLVAGVTASPALRTLAWWLTLAGAAVAAAVWSLRRFVQTSADRIGGVLGPFASGTLAVALTLLVAEGVLTTATAWVASKLPGEFGTQFTTMTDSVVTVYGPTTVVLGAVAFLLVLAAGAIYALWVILATGYVEERTAGIAVASVALFGTAAFAGVLEVSNALVLAALVGAVVVWDAGEFGVTLGREIGRRASTRRAELVHATGTLAVGGVGAGVALLVADLSVGAVSLGTGPVALGLLAVLGGLLLLVAALR